MCLELESRKTRVKTAEEDIVVYKALKLNNKPTINQLPKIKHGDSFKGTIRGIECEGKISIDKSGNIFFCTNNLNLNGYFTYNKLGYKYSWGFDSNVYKIIVNGEIMYDTEIIGYQTFYQGFKVEMGETYTSEFTKRYNYIEKGLHSFETMEGAKSVSGIVAKCVIPKGSQYYKGTFLGNTSYASDKLTYVE